MTITKNRAKSSSHNNTGDRNTHYEI